MVSGQLVKIKIRKSGSTKGQKKRCHIYHINLNDMFSPVLAFSHISQLIVLDQGSD